MIRPAVEDFTFKVNLVAVVRVRADDESVARKIVPTVLGAPGTVEIRLANENNTARGHRATVTDVDFSIGSDKLIEGWFEVEESRRMCRRKAVTEGRSCWQSRRLCFV